MSSREEWFRTFFKCLKTYKFCWSGIFLEVQSPKNCQFWLLVQVSRTGLGIRSSVFWANHLFMQKNERFAQINKRFAHSLIFGEQPERFTHGRSLLVSVLSQSLMVAHFWWATWVIRWHRSFLVSNLRDSLTSLNKKEGMSKSFIFKNQKMYIKHTKK